MTVIPDEVGAAGPVVRHRYRMRDSLRGLPTWSGMRRRAAPTGPSRMSSAIWSPWTRDRMFAFNAARTDDPPTKFLEHFDPSSGTDVQVAALVRKVPSADAVGEEFRAQRNRRAVVQLVKGFPPEDWDAIAKSPLGHLPARSCCSVTRSGTRGCTSARHVRTNRAGTERRARRVARGDVLLPAVRRAPGRTPRRRGGATGDAVPSEPVEATLRFDELPDAGVRVVYDTGVRVELDLAARWMPARQSRSSRGSRGDSRWPSPRVGSRHTSPPTSPAANVL